MIERPPFMKKFVFGILSYNQEDYILETLESIKYQKIQYGTDIDVSLIITDDASKDRTVEKIRRWAEKNREYFADIELIANQKNQGTVANFCTIVRKTQNADLKIIAGDDLIGSENIFAEYEDLNEKKLKTYFRIELCDGRISYREKYLIDFYYHKKHNDGRAYHLKNFRRGCYLHTPSTLYTKQLFLNADCEKNLEGYRLFEDDPMWYSMLKNEKNLEIEFVEQGIVLYRMHNQSVSNVPNPIFRNDLKKLREQYLKETKGFEHFYCWIQIHSKNLPMYLNPGLYMDKVINIKRKLVCKKDKGYQLFKEKIERQIAEEQKYYNNIIETISKENVLE